MNRNSAVIGLVLLLSLLSLRGSEAQDTYQLQYSINAKEWTHPGGTFTVMNIFLNKGNLPLRVISVAWATDFGTFRAETGIPLVLAGGEKKELDMDIRVPSTASVGNHPSTASTTYQYQDPSTLQWASPAGGPLELEWEIAVVQAPPPKWLELIPFVGGILALVLMVALLLGRRLYAGPIVTLPR